MPEFLAFHATVKHHETGMLPVQSGDRKAHSSKHSGLCTHSELESPLPEAISLPAPPLMPPTVGSNCIHLSWGKVNNASGYIIEVSNASTFANPMTLAVQAATSWGISGLQPGTTYYLRITAVGIGTYANSVFSNAPPVTTLAEGAGETNDGVVGDLQTWLNNLQTEFQNVVTLVPQLENTNLNSAARMRLNGSGVRRYGFIEKTADVSAEFPQFWRASGPRTEALTAMVREIEVLRNLLVWFRWAARVVQDMLLVTGDEAFRLAGAYYTVTRDEARRKNPEAEKVFEMLRLFWNRRRRTSEEPTLPEIERDFRRVLYGTKDGTVSAKHESPKLSGGVHEVVDNVRR